MFVQPGTSSSLSWAYNYNLLSALHPNHHDWHDLLDRIYFHEAWILE
jgi:hypothetical protein